MIITVLLYVLGFILGIVAEFCDTLSFGLHVWPAVILNGLTYFFSILMKIDFILNIRALLFGIQWALGFLVAYYGIKLLLKIVNWFRGSGSIEV
jgi:hypothetical protein